MNKLYCIVIMSCLITIGLTLTNRFKIAYLDLLAIILEHLSKQNLNLVKRE